MRSGTLNVPGIVGFGKACELSDKEMVEESARLTQLRERLRQGILKGLDEVYLNGDPIQRLPGNLNMSFAYVEGESLLMGLKEVALSSGSACTTATLEPSYVLRSLGLEATWLILHFDLGWDVSIRKKKSTTSFNAWSRRFDGFERCPRSMRWPKRD